jgi:hypothetical protein
MCNHLAMRKAAAASARSIPVAVALGVAAVAGVVVWLVLRGGGSSTGVMTTGTTAPLPTLPRAVSAGELGAVAARVARPVFWAGPRARTVYELTRTENGRVYVRYLPRKSEVGNESIRALTVATYAVSNGYVDLQAAARRRGSVKLEIENNGLVVYNDSSPGDIYLSYPGAGYQVEVYSPVSGQSLELVASGKIRPVGAAATSTGASSAAQSVSRAELRARAALLAGPIYWAGPRTHSTYELTVTPSGKTYIRYLPPGVKAGARTDFLTIATYPDPLGYRHVVAARARLGARVKAVGGAVAASLPGSKSVFLSRPGAKYQVEIYSPTAGEAKRLVETGQIRPIR